MARKRPANYPQIGEGIELRFLKGIHTCPPAVQEHPPDNKEAELSVAEETPAEMNMWMATDNGVKDSIAAEAVELGQGLDDDGEEDKEQG